MAARVASWEAALSSYIQDGLTAKFEWGRCDCCLWAAAWVERCCGWHPAKDLVGRYSSSTGARRIIQREGGFVPMLNRRLGRQPIQTPFMAKRGDIAAVPGVAGIAHAVGIVLGPKVALLTPQGLHRAPIHTATHTWRVG